MNESTTYIQVVFTSDTMYQAERISISLLEKRLVASAQTVSIWSQYWWQGKIWNRQEFRCTLKTRSNMFSQVASEIRAQHTYKVPEIFAVPLVYSGDPRVV